MDTKLDCGKCSNSASHDVIVRAHDKNNKRIVKKKIVCDECYIELLLDDLVLHDDEVRGWLNKNG